jgi:Uma2 family endonuclease
MTAFTKLRMSADEFLAWTTRHPEEKRHELAAGEVVAMSPERVRHNESKGNIYFALRQALRSQGLPCRTHTDGLSVRVDETTIYEPDAFVRCGDPLAGDTVEVTDPVIVVEVVSPSSQAIDSGAKLAGYFKLPSVRHYLIVDSTDRTVIHHTRTEDERIETCVVRSGPLSLDPPGLTVEVDAFFQD